MCACAGRAFDVGAVGLEDAVGGRLDDGGDHLESIVKLGSDAPTRERTVIRNSRSVRASKRPYVKRAATVGDLCRWLRVGSGLRFSCDSFKGRQRWR